MRTAPSLPEVTLKIYLPDGKQKDIDTEIITVFSLLEACQINPLEVIVTRNGQLVPEDAVVSGDDEIKVFRVAHGG
jgi:sulfur carrier protein